VLVRLRLAKPQALSGAAGSYYSLTGSHVTFRSPIPSHHWKLEVQKPLRRTFAIILAALAVAALFGGLVHLVLVVAHVSQPAPTTVQGLTPRRLWATIVAGLALFGVVIGGGSGQASQSFRHNHRAPRSREVLPLLQGQSPHSSPSGHQSWSSKIKSPRALAWALKFW